MYWNFLKHVFYLYYLLFVRRFIIKVAVARSFAHVPVFYRLIQPCSNIKMYPKNNTVQSIRGYARAYITVINFYFYIYRR